MSNASLQAMPHHEGLISIAFRALSEAIRSKLAWDHAYNDTYRELNNLAERELTDLGFVRADLHKISLNAANEKMGLS